MTEDHIHKSILRYLRSILPHGWLVVHVPNGGSRGRTAEERAVAGAKMKALGVVAGWPDLSIYGDTGSYFMEVKAPKGRVQPCQVAIMDRLKDMGFPVAVVRSIEDARACVEEWGLPSREVRQ